MLHIYSFRPLTTYNCDVVNHLVRIYKKVINELPQILCSRLKRVGSHLSTHQTIPRIDDRGYLPFLVLFDGSIIAVGEILHSRKRQPPKPKQFPLNLCWSRFHMTTPVGEGGGVETTS